MASDESHPCAHSGCTHLAEFSDERHCYYHTAPVMVEHECVVEGCGHYGQAKRLSYSLDRAELIEELSLLAEVQTARREVRRELAERAELERLYDLNSF